MAQPKVEPMGHDPVDGKERMGDVARTAPGEELSDDWYHTKALRLVHDYGQNLEGCWEEIAVKQFARHNKATNGVEIDEDKLMKAIKELIEEKEDKAMENPLKETLAWLSGQHTEEMLKEGVLPDITEEVDPVLELIEGGLTSEQYVKQALQLFQIKESMLPLGIRKYRLGEGNARQTKVPCVGTLPHRQGFRALDERALDMFCNHWTQHQAMAGEPLRLEWVNHPSDASKIGFTCVLK